MAKPQKSERAEQEYVLGTNRDELVRLGLQHQLWARYAADAWERAGFGPGKKLLDVGCGPGYASLDLAARVGTRGQVRAIDISKRFIRHLQSHARLRGVTCIQASVGHVERLNLSKGTFDGAYARWVLCFVENPAAVVSGVSRALKKGGAFVIQDYFNYESVLIAPNCDVFRRFFKMVAQSWRMRGGNSDIGAEIPNLLARHGFEVKEIKPLLRVARPGSPLWKWPEVFFENYLPVLVELGLFSESDKDEFNREWRKRSRDPSAFFVTPPMIEVIGIKR
jgi:ubiquinone/menaquinone biosynthesis C-methylase UbiE